MRTIFCSLFFTFLYLCGFSQGVDHWETVVYNDNLWRYQVGVNTPPPNWAQPNFDASAWAIGNGGFGYGDDDDNTQIANTLSVYIRHQFELIDTSVITFAILHADYDDAFVAYLNGVEIARSNIGTVGVAPSYNEPSSGLHEAGLYQGITPEPYTLSGQDLKNLIVEGTNTLAIQIHNESQTSTDLSSNFFWSVGITDSSMSYGETPDWFVSPFFETTLPLLIINTTQTNEIFDEPKVQAYMGIVDNGPGQTNSIFDDYNDYDGFIAIEIRGASSQLFDKKGYGFETQLEDGTNNNVELLGLPEENDWILHGPYTDKSLLRNVLAYHMGELTGRYTPRTRLCELFINDDYRGVYVLTERIKRDENRVDIANLKPEDIEGDELTGGYIVQIDRDDNSTNLDGWYSDYPDNKFFVFHVPNEDDIQPQQRAYIQGYFDEFESKMAAADYQSTYLGYLDIDSWIDYFLITEVGKHIDAYKLSFYMNKKKLSNGGKIHFGPLWDFNLAFGNFDFACPPEPEGWAFEWRGTCDNSHPFWVSKLTEIPEVSHQINCRWNELRDGPLSSGAMIDFIDEKVAEIGDAQERNFNRWPILGEYVWPNNFIGNTYAEEIGYLKFWLNQRLGWMDANMLGDCSLLNSVEPEVVEQSRVELFPNPATDELYVELAYAPSDEVELQLYNLLGQQMARYPLTTIISKIDLTLINTGLYVYRVTGEEGEIGHGLFMIE